MTKYEAAEKEQRRQTCRAFKELLGEVGLTFKDFARAFGMSPETTKSWTKLIWPPAYTYQIIDDMKECPQYKARVLERAKNDDKNHAHRHSCPSRRARG